MGNLAFPPPYHPCSVVPLVELPIENNKCPNFEWRGQGKCVDPFVLWSYPIWVRCLWDLDSSPGWLPPVPVDLVTPPPPWWLLSCSLLVPLPLYLSASLPPELCPLRFVFSVYIWHRTCKLEEFINNGLTPLEKCKFFDDIEMTFFPTVYSVLYCSKSVSACSDWKQ